MPVCVEWCLLRFWSSEQTRQLAWHPVWIGGMSKAPVPMQQFHDVSKHAASTKCSIATPGRIVVGHGCPMQNEPEFVSLVELMVNP
eukprot:6487646-Amphidinium_carterae.2